MTTGASLITRVRSNINEPSGNTDPHRTDTEILQWLDDAQLDYLHKVPQEHFPELITSATFTGSRVNIPADYLFFYSLTLSHTISTSDSVIEDCWVLGVGDTYLIQNYPGILGAWCQMQGSSIVCGPNPVSGTLTYVKAPTSLSTSSATFSLGKEHEVPIVFYASARALLKVNDADAQTFMTLYQDSIAAKVSRGESGDIERA